MIQTEKENLAALSRVEETFDSKKNSKTADELELLALLIEKYEDETSPIDLPDPIEAIKFSMDQHGYKQKDLAQAIGLKSRVSEILNKKRKPTTDRIRKLHATLGIPTEVLIKEN